jgi:cytochrome c2
MRYLIVIAIFSLVIILSCKISKEKGGLFTTGNLPSAEYTINIDKDTTLQTENGALLKIPRGALKPESGNTVTLEIKEAYSLSEMIKAGLVTQSNGQPLSSGGMIYINAAAGQKITITRAIKVAIPADYLRKGMELYKGDTSNGKINWISPIALPENKQLTSIEKGQILFQQNCASCHAIGKDLTGPDLAHFMKRFPIDEEGNYPYYQHGIIRPQEKSDNIEKFLDKSRDTSYGYYGDFYSFYNIYSAYKCNLINKYGTTSPIMNSDTTNNYLLPVFRYIENESNFKNLPLPSHAFLKNCIDSCNSYKTEIMKLRYEKIKAGLKKQGLVKNNGPLVDKKPDTSWTINNNLPLPADFDKRVSPDYYDAEYYQFTIESFGWYNIDMLLKDVNGVEESELFVRVVGEYKEKIKILLIIPSVKVYGEGGPAEKPGEFAFFYKTGKLPLPQNTDAYVLAVTETEQSIAFGIKKFTTGKQQEFELSPRTSSKQEFTAAMKEFDMERLHIKIGDSKNANEIRNIDRTLKKIDEKLKDVENLKPKACDCDCGQQTILR